MLSIVMLPMTGALWLVVIGVILVAAKDAKSYTTFILIALIGISLIFFNIKTVSERIDAYDKKIIRNHVAVESARTNR